VNSNLPKIAIIGSGNVGSNAALLTALSVTADIALVDIVDGLAEGRALDISQALAILGNETRVSGGSDYGAIGGSDIVVVTAGLPRQPGMTRTDLLHKNAAIIRSAAAEIVEHAPGATLVIVTNPLDVMTHLAWLETGLKPEKVLGMGGLLDSGRFNHFLSKAAGVARGSIEAIVIGSHGDEMVPVSRLATAGGVPLERIIGSAALAEAAEKAKHGGAEIVGLLKKGSAAYAPGAALSLMIKSLLGDEKRVFSVCCRPSGEYGYEDIYLNLPAVLGRGGVESIIELELSPAEKEALARSAEAVRSMTAELT
jgi:malate dehydrogenase